MAHPGRLTWLAPATRRYSTSTPLRCLFGRKRRCRESVKAGAACCCAVIPDAGHPVARRVGVSLRCSDSEYGPQGGVGSAAPAGSGPAPLQGETHLAEPRAGDLGPFPAVRGQGGCRNVGQGGVQRGQFEASLGSGVEVPARGGFVKKPFRFAVVIWTVHSVLLVVVRVVWSGSEAYV